MKKLLVFLFSLSMLLSLVHVQNVQASSCTLVKAEVGYQVKTSSEVTGFAYGGVLASSSSNEPIRSLALHLENATYGAGIEVRTYASGTWSNWVSDFTFTEEKDVITGLQIRLTDYPHADVHYQTVRQDGSVGIWVKNGTTSGNLKSPIVGVRIKVFEVGVTYGSDVKSGQTSFVKRSNDEVLGKGIIETINVELQNAPADAKVVYRAHFHDWDWSDFVSNGTELGKVGSGKWIEAIEVKLENMPGYSVAYQVEVQGMGWTEWKYDGEMSGTTGLTTPISNYRIKIVKNYCGPVEVEQPVEENPSEESDTPDMSGDISSGKTNGDDTTPEKKDIVYKFNDDIEVYGYLDEINLKPLSNDQESAIKQKYSTLTTQDEIKFFVQVEYNNGWYDLSDSYLYISQYHPEGGYGNITRMKIVDDELQSYDFFTYKDDIAELNVVTAKKLETMPTKPEAIFLEVYSYSFLNYLKSVD